LIKTPFFLTKKFLDVMVIPIVTLLMVLDSTLWVDANTLWLQPTVEEERDS
jgi:hypothetical protein